MFASRICGADYAPASCRIARRIGSDRVGSVCKSVSEWVFAIGTYVSKQAVDKRKRNELVALE